MRFRPGDAVAVAAVVLAALAMIAFMFFSAVPAGSAAVVRVYQEGRLIREMPLSEDAEWTVEGPYTNRIAVRGGRVAFLESSCPGEDCVHSGWIDRPGRSLVCLPNRVEIRLEGQTEEDDVDAVVW